MAGGDKLMKVLPICSGLVDKTKLLTLYIDYVYIYIYTFIRILYIYAYMYMIYIHIYI